MNPQTRTDAATDVVITSTTGYLQDDTGPGFGLRHSSAWFPHRFTCTDGHDDIQTIQ